MSKILVLGANGFIGSHLVDSLVDAGHSVRAFDRFGGATNFIPHTNIEKVSGDFLNKADLSNALTDIEYVFHFISTTTPASAENDPKIDIDTNIRASVELFELCVEKGIKRVIFASTGGAIYGEGTNPHLETDTALPVSPYAIGKLTIEHYLRYFRIKHGLDSVVLRISNPYGERQPFHRKQGVVPIFLENIANDLPITVLGDGSMIRDYVYVKDVADMAAEVFDKPLLHDTYNIGSGHGVRLSELVDVIQTVTGKTPKIEQRDVPATYIHEVVLDTERFAREFKERTLVPLSEGIAKTYSYILNEMKRANDGQ